MNDLLVWLNARTLHSRRSLTLAAFLAALTAATGVSLALGEHPVTTLVGSLSGLVMFGSAFGFWHTALPETARNRTDLKQHLTLPQRRFTVLALGIMWLILTLAVGSSVPYGLGGAFMVFVVCALIVTWRTTDQEKADLLAYQAELEAQEKAEAAAARARRKAAAEAARTDSAA